MNIENSIMVTVWCTVYNHEPYIRDCLEGFMNQKTNFRYEVVVHDDASTDKSAAIIQQYAEKYPDIIKPILQTENQYSKKNGAIRRIREENSRGKYVAICEGDDYWTDPHKLQEQVDFMESHPEYSLACTDAVVLSGKTELDWHRYDNDCEISLEDIIHKRGAWIYTASMLYRKHLLDDYPVFAQKCHVGDYPKAIHLALRGKVYFFAKKMVTYRYLTPGSWSSTTRIDESYFPKWLSEIRMLQGYNQDSGEQYHKYFERVMGKLAVFYLRHVPSMKEKVLEVLPDFPKWLDIGDKLKWLKLELRMARARRHAKQS